MEKKRKNKKDDFLIVILKFLAHHSNAKHTAPANS